MIYRSLLRFMQRFTSFRNQLETKNFIKLIAVGDVY